MSSERLNEIWDTYQALGFGSGPVEADAYIASLSIEEVSAFTEAAGQVTYVNESPVSEISAAAAGCFSREGSVLVESTPFRDNLFRYFEFVSWCSDGFVITSFSCNAYGSVFALGWLFAGNLTYCAVEAGGNGFTTVQQFSQGIFQFSVNGTVFQTNNPFVRVTAGSAGNSTVVTS